MSETRRMTATMQLRMGPGHDAFLRTLAQRSGTTSAQLVRDLLERYMRDVAESNGSAEFLAGFDARDEAGEVGEDVSFAQRLAQLVDVDDPAPSLADRG